jgi:hypothetical protein
MARLEEAFTNAFDIRDGRNWISVRMSMPISDEMEDRTGQTCSYRGTHAAHNSQLISLQAKQHSESAGQRALIEANQRPVPGIWFRGMRITRRSLDRIRQLT